MFLQLRERLFQTLRWSEKYTKTDMVYLASGGFWITIGQAVSSISALALAIAFANLAPQETYGTYKYLLSLAAIFSIFTLPGMNSAIAQAVAKGDDSIVRPALRSRIQWSMLGTLISFAGGLYYFINGNVELGSALILIGVTIPFFDTFTLYNGYLTGKKNFKTETTYHLLSQTISVIFIIVTIFLTKNVLLILLAYFMPLAIVRFFIFKRTTHALPPISKDKKIDISYGKHLSAINILGVIASNVDKILLWKLLGPVQLAIYSFAVAIPEQARGPFKGLSNIALPKFAAQPPGSIQLTFRSFWYTFLMYIILLFIVSMAYIAIAPTVFKILFPNYLESVFYSQILAFFLFTGAQSIPATLLTAYKRTGTQYILTVSRSTIQIILLFILIPQFGIMGAVFAIVATNTFNLITTIVAVVLEHRRGYI